MGMERIVLQSCNTNFLSSINKENICNRMILYVYYILQSIGSPFVAGLRIRKSNLWKHF